MKDGVSQTIDGFIEGQAFPRSYDLAPRPAPPTFPVTKLDQRHTGRLRKKDKSLTGGGGSGVGEDPNHTTTRKPGPL
jgi:hypothetical protein